MSDPTGLKRFGDLTISEIQPDVKSFIRVLRRDLPEGWSFVESNHPFPSDVTYQFQLVSPEPYSPANLWLYERGQHKAVVVNIISESQSALSFDEYNEILQTFSRQVVEPVAPEAHAVVTLEIEQLLISELLDPDAYAAFRRFLGVPNKAAPTSHPLDEERWLDFLIAVFCGHSDMDAHTFGRFLVEDFSWPEDVVHDLTLEYEFAMSLLARSAVMS